MPNNLTVRSATSPPTTAPTAPTAISVPYHRSLCSDPLKANVTLIDDSGYLGNFNTLDVERCLTEHPPAQRLMLIVDQFEELFRFNSASASSQEQSIDFVNLLLQATQQADADTVPQFQHTHAA